MVEFLKGAGKWLLSTVFTTVVIVALVLVTQKYCPFLNPNHTPAPTPPAPTVNQLEEAWKNDKDAEKTLHKQQLSAFLQVAARSYVPDPTIFKRRSDVFTILHNAATHYLGNAMMEERKVLAAEWLVLLKQDADLTEEDRKAMASMFEQAAEELNKLK